jgi:hypothetical protein
MKIVPGWLVFTHLRLEGLARRLGRKNLPSYCRIKNMSMVVNIFAVDIMI